MQAALASLAHMSTVDMPVSEGVRPILGTISLLVLIGAHPRAVHPSSKGTELRLLVRPLGNATTICKLVGWKCLWYFPWRSWDTQCHIMLPKCQTDHSNPVVFWGETWPLGDGS